MLLLRLEARPDTVDRLGLAPLFHAARDGNLRLVRTLLAAGAYLTLKQQHWTRQPSFLAEINHPEILQLISTTCSVCPPLTWLARSAFRNYAKQSSSLVAARFRLPQCLALFIDFADDFDSWI